MIKRVTVLFFLIVVFFKVHGGTIASDLTENFRLVCSGLNDLNKNYDTYVMHKMMSNQIKGSEILFLGVHNYPFLFQGIDEFDNELEKTKIEVEKFENDITEWSRSTIESISHMEISQKKYEKIDSLMRNLTNTVAQRMEGIYSLFYLFDEFQMNTTAPSYLQEWDNPETIIKSRLQDTLRSCRYALNTLEAMNIEEKDEQLEQQYTEIVAEFNALAHGKYSDFVSDKHPTAPFSLGLGYGGIAAAVIYIPVMIVNLWRICRRAQ